MTCEHFPANPLILKNSIKRLLIVSYCTTTLQHARGVAPRQYPEVKPAIPHSSQPSALDSALRKFERIQSPLMVYRSDNRACDQLRPVKFVPNYISLAEGSCLIEVGNTRVVCTATIEDTVPQFLRNSGKGWITAEYGMLPRATLTRSPREVTKGRASGRTHEIQRLIGRSLRAVTDLEKLGERTLFLD